MPKGGRREQCWLSAEGIEGQTSSAHPPPNIKLKLGRNLGVHKASPNGSSPWQKYYHSKKWKKKIKETKKKQQKTNTRRVGNTAIVIQPLECTKTEIRDLASLLNFKNNKSLQITLLIGFKLEF